MLVCIRYWITDCRSLVVSILIGIGKPHAKVTLKVIITKVAMPIGLLNLWISVAFELFHTTK